MKIQRIELIAIIVTLILLSIDAILNPPFEVVVCDQVLANTQQYIQMDTEQSNMLSTFEAYQIKVASEDVSTGDGRLVMEDTEEKDLPSSLQCKPEVLNSSIFVDLPQLQSEFNKALTTNEDITNEDIIDTDITDTDNIPNSDSDDEYANLAIANVTDYVNVREEPNTNSKILGKIYNGAVAQILTTAGAEDEWFYVESGSVTGYIKAEFFIYGDAAQDVIDQYVTHYVTTNADCLNVRKEATTDSKRLGYMNKGEKIEYLEDLGDFIKIKYTEDKVGYVASEYVTKSEEFTYAISREEEKALLAQKKALEEREHVNESQAPENTMQFTLPENTYTSNEELRKTIVDYARQYLGNVYIHGGRSLSGGTDCSGFTCYIYSDFGYSISRTPGGQYSSAGRSIDMSEIQPGDIICYSSSGSKCTHVALYIGDGKIIHSANSKKGVIESQADYSKIIGVRNVID